MRAPRPGPRRAAIVRPCELDSSRRVTPSTSGTVAARPSGARRLVRAASRGALPWSSRPRAAMRVLRRSSAVATLVAEATPATSGTSARAMLARADSRGWRRGGRLSWSSRRPPRARTAGIAGNHVRSRRVRGAQPTRFARGRAPAHAAPELVHPRPGGPRSYAMHGSRKRPDPGRGSRTRKRRSRTSTFSGKPSHRFR